MNVAVLGTGVVGEALATKLVSIGHSVAMGSRRAGNEKAAGWAASAGDIGAARGLEMYLPLWLRPWSATGTGRLNVHVVRET